MFDPTKIKQEDLESMLEIINDPGAWAETFLVNFENNEPFRLNFVQEKILSTRHRKKAIRVHRRAGKSFLLAAFSLWYCLTHPAGQVLIICPEQKQVTLLFNTIDKFIWASPGFQDSVVENRKSPAWRKFRNGSTIAGFTTGARSNAKGQGIRGQSADVVIIDEAAYLKEGDWEAITPIMIGDATRKGKVICMVSSTPTQEHGVYYTYCTKDYTDEPESARWEQIHVPITENADFSAEDVADIRANENEITWAQEWLALFPDIGEGVFRPSYVERAVRSFDYYPVLNNPSWVPTEAVRTIGVDWDKYQATPNIVVMELDTTAQHYKLCYREEIPKSDFCLTAAVQRIIELNDLFQPSHIYVDRGFGETNVELLHLHGIKFPATGLASKVRGVQFSETVEAVDPADGTSVKKRIKPYMVNILVRWLEEGLFTYPIADKEFTKQLLDYKVLRVTDNTITYTSENEHILDAVMLACLALYENYANPFSINPAVDTYLLPAPQPVVQQDAGVDSNGDRYAYGCVVETNLTNNGFSRRKMVSGTTARGFTRSLGENTKVIGENGLVKVRARF